MAKITMSEVLNAYWNDNAEIPHITLLDGKCFHNAIIETMNDTEIKFKRHKTILLKDIKKVEIPQHSRVYNTSPFRELVCKKILGKSFDDTITDLEKHYTDSTIIGNKYSLSKATRVSKEINNVKVIGIKTYNTLTDINIENYLVGVWYSNTSSRWGTFGNGINTLWNN